jgi:hypothetical protein
VLQHTANQHLHHHLYLLYQEVHLQYQSHYHHRHLFHLHFDHLLKQHRHHHLP